MNDSQLLKQALEPKSDQLNADDLIAGPITIKVRKVTVAASGEQRIAFHYDGDNNKPYKPCKSMGRAIMELWGDDPSVYIGRSMTLYRDPEIIFGKDKVGGIRVSHMSDISEETELHLTVKRSIRKPFTVRPLQQVQAMNVEAIKEDGKTQASKGIETLKAWWTGIGGAQQKAIGGAAFLEELKAIANNHKPEESGNEQ